MGNFELEPIELEEIKFDDLIFDFDSWGKDWDKAIEEFTKPFEL